MVKRFYTPQEVASLFSVSPTTVMSRIHDGALPAVRVSKRIYRIPVPAFERFVSTRPMPSFAPEYRRVERVRKLGEQIASPSSDDLVKV
ncbi:MAG: helix-turn-helix domain-containing protein [Chloroflexi bacterium]|nr:helix-turn-helix domain-containing protein [Chloroflexota bacterium]MBA3796043.1 helix-turn-helix domain-containing protein [Chloroflexota bacterium]